MDTLYTEFSSSLDVVSNKLSNWQDTIVSQIPNLIVAIILCLLAYFLSGWVKKAVAKATRKFAHNETVVSLMSNIAITGFAIIIIFLVLSIFNLDSTVNKLLATAGVFGLAIGLALQDPIKNLFSGVSLSVHDLFRIGDLIETNGYFGTITSIDLRNTIIKSLSGEVVIIPNKEVVQSALINYSTSGERRVDVKCGISYGENLEIVKKIVIEAISGIKGLQDGREIEFLYDAFGDSSINFIVRFWVNAVNQKTYLEYASEAIINIKGAFDANDIIIPFPIRTLDFGIKGGVSLNSVLNSEKLTYS